MEQLSSDAMISGGICTDELTDVRLYSVLDQGVNYPLEKYLRENERTAVLTGVKALMPVDIIEIEGEATNNLATYVTLDTDLMRKLHPSDTNEALAGRMVDHLHAAINMRLLFVRPYSVAIIKVQFASKALWLLHSHEGSQHHLVPHHRSYGTYLGFYPVEISVFLNRFRVDDQALHGSQFDFARYLLQRFTTALAGGDGFSISVFVKDGYWFAPRLQTTTNYTEAFNLGLDVAAANQKYAETTTLLSQGFFTSAYFTQSLGQYIRCQNEEKAAEKFSKTPSWRLPVTKLEHIDVIENYGNSRQTPFNTQEYLYLESMRAATLLPRLTNVNLSTYMRQRTRLPTEIITPVSQLTKLARQTDDAPLVWLQRHISSDMFAYVEKEAARVLRGLGLQVSNFAFYDYGLLYEALSEAAFVTMARLEMTYYLNSVRQRTARSNGDHSKLHELIIQQLPLTLSGVFMLSQEDALYGVAPANGYYRSMYHEPELYRFLQKKYAIWLAVFKFIMTHGCLTPKMYVLMAEFHAQVNAVYKQLHEFTFPGGSEIVVCDYLYEVAVWLVFTTQEIERGKYLQRMLTRHDVTISDNTVSDVSAFPKIPLAFHVDMLGIKQLAQFIQGNTFSEEYPLRVRFEGAALSSYHTISKYHLRENHDELARDVQGDAGIGGIFMAFKERPAFDWSVDSDPVIQCGGDRFDLTQLGDAMRRLYLASLSPKILALAAEKLGLGNTVPEIDYSHDFFVDVLNKPRDRVSALLAAIFLEMHQKSKSEVADVIKFMANLAFLRPPEDTELLWMPFIESIVGFTAGTDKKLAPNVQSMQLHENPDLSGFLKLFKTQNFLQDVVVGKAQLLKKLVSAMAMKNYEKAFSRQMTMSPTNAAKLDQFMRDIRLVTWLVHSPLFHAVKRNLTRLYRPRGSHAVYKTVASQPFEGSVFANIFLHEPERSTYLEPWKVVRASAFNPTVLGALKTATVTSLNTQRANLIFGFKMTAVPMNRIYYGEMLSTEQKLSWRYDRMEYVNVLDPMNASVQREGRVRVVPQPMLKDSVHDVLFVTSAGLKAPLTIGASFTRLLQGLVVSCQKHDDAAVVPQYGAYYHLLRHFLDNYHQFVRINVDLKRSATEQSMQIYGSLFRSLTLDQWQIAESLAVYPEKRQAILDIAKYTNVEVPDSTVVMNAFGVLDEVFGRYLSHLYSDPVVAATSAQGDANTASAIFLAQQAHVFLEGSKARTFTIDATRVARMLYSGLTTASSEYPATPITITFKHAVTDTFQFEEFVHSAIFCEKLPSDNAVQNKPPWSLSSMEVFRICALYGSGNLRPMKLTKSGVLTEESNLSALHLAMSPTEFYAPIIGYVSRGIDYWTEHSAPRPDAYRDLKISSFHHATSQRLKIPQALPTIQGQRGFFEGDTGLAQVFDMNFDGPVNFSELIYQPLWVDAQTPRVTVLEDTENAEFYLVPLQNAPLTVGDTMGFLAGEVTPIEIYVRNNVICDGVTAPDGPGIWNERSTWKEFIDALNGVFDRETLYPVDHFTWFQVTDIQFAGLYPVLYPDFPVPTSFTFAVHTPEDNNGNVSTSTFSPTQDKWHGVNDTMFWHVAVIRGYEISGQRFSSPVRYVRYTDNSLQANAVFKRVDRREIASLGGSYPDLSYWQLVATVDIGATDTRQEIVVHVPQGDLEDDITAPTLTWRKFLFGSYPVRARYPPNMIQQSFKGVMPYFIQKPVHDKIAIVPPRLFSNIPVSPLPLFNPRMVKANTVTPSYLLPPTEEPTLTVIPPLPYIAQPETKFKVSNASLVAHKTARPLWQLPTEGARLFMSDALLYEPLFIFSQPSAEPLTSIPAATSVPSPVPGPATSTPPVIPGATISPLPNQPWQSPFSLSQPQNVINSLPGTSSTSPPPLEEDPFSRYDSYLDDLGDLDDDDSAAANYNWQPTLRAQNTQVVFRSYRS